MSKEEDNKAIVGRWFNDFWGKTCDLGIVDELAKRRRAVGLGVGRRAQAAAA
jgi:hypothetical protein